MKCNICKTTDTDLWHPTKKEGKDASGYSCHTCHIKKMKEKTLISKQQSSKRKTFTKQKLIVSKRVPKPSKKRLLGAEKGRRTLSKPKKAAKAILTQAEDKTSDYICFKGQIFQKGDIVSVVDSEDNNIYYAQCLIFLTDKYYKKYVGYNWLAPREDKTFQTNEEFVPSKYKIAFSDEVFHCIETINFVCHAPTDYYFENRNRALSNFLPPRNSISYVMK